MILALHFPAPDRNGNNLRRIGGQCYPLLSDLKRCQFRTPALLRAMVTFRSLKELDDSKGTVTLVDGMTAIWRTANSYSNFS
jgi:hypothetical protein